LILIYNLVEEGDEFAAAASAFPETDTDWSL
jgi:hypothetical protein